MLGFMHFENFPLGNSHTHPHPNFPHGHSNKANYLTSHAHIVKNSLQHADTHIYKSSTQDRVSLFSGFNSYYKERSIKNLLQFFIWMAWQQVPILPQLNTVHSEHTPLVPLTSDNKKVQRKWREKMVYQLKLLQVAKFIKKITYNHTCLQVYQELDLDAELYFI